MYKKIIVIIILSFFFILSCAKNNPNNPNSSESGNVSDGGDTGGSTGDGGNTGDSGQTQSPLAKYAGAWKDGYKVYVIGEEGYFIYSASSSSGSGPILIESGEKLSDTQYKFLYDKEPKKKIDATITFNDENNASIEGVQYNYFSSKDIPINGTLKKEQKTTGIDNKYVGTWKCNDTKSYTLTIKEDGSIEHNNSGVVFSIPASKILKNTETSYQAYWFKTTYKDKQAILEMTLDFTDENNCKFNFKFTYTDGSGGFYPGTLVNYTKNK